MIPPRRADMVQHGRRPLLAAWAAAIAAPYLDPTRFSLVGRTSVLNCIPPTHQTCAGRSANMPFELSESKSAMVAEMKASLSKLETEEGGEGGGGPDREVDGARRQRRRCLGGRLHRELKAHPGSSLTAAGRMKGVHFSTPQPDDIFIVSPPK